MSFVIVVAIVVDRKKKNLGRERHTVSILVKDYRQGLEFFEVTCVDVRLSTELLSRTIRIFRRHHVVLSTGYRGYSCLHIPVNKTY